jgi:isopropylmalate/homocitrate/citramalate synthase
VAADSGADEVCLESAADAERLAVAATTVRELGIDVSLAFAEAYSYDEVVKLCRAGLELGCRSQSFHDSFFRLGIHPDAIRAFISRLTSDVGDLPPLYVHLSNFYGHATMTAVAALTAGASAVDVCMNGTGHHCGHTSLAEVTLVLEHLYGVSTGIRTEALQGAYQLVMARSRVPMPLTQPVVGPFAFMGDGAYWAAESHLPFEERIHATFPFEPGVVGSEERVIWNDRTTTIEAVEHRLKSAGVAVTPERSLAIIAELRRELERRDTYPAWLADEEFLALAMKSTDEPSPATVR